MGLKRFSFGVLLLMTLISPTRSERNSQVYVPLNFSHPAREIPARFTCEGADVSPPLVWEGVPAKAKSLALIIDDPDAPDPASPQMTWVHWVLFTICRRKLGSRSENRDN